jgi:GNAT superfamily N-acetyltransferase
MDVRVAATDEERAQAYRVRYDVFCTEHGDNRYADHESRMFTDENDKKRTDLLIACDEMDQVIGTSRVTVHRECTFIKENLYAFDRLAMLMNCPVPQILNAVALFDRVAVLPQWRGKAVMAQLARAMERIAVDSACRVAVAVTLVANTHSQNCLRLLGWTQYQTQEEKGLSAILWCKQLVADENLMLK